MGHPHFVQLSEFSGQILVVQAVLSPGLKSFEVRANLLAGVRYMEEMRM